MSGLTIISLFCGAGGFDLGLVRAGLNVAWANDIYGDAIATYRLNFGVDIDTRDICDIPSSEIPDADVVVGGFPCQGFSVANWARSVNDERNKIYCEMVRVVDDKKPKYFVVENVKGLVSLGRGEILKNIISEFTQAGYNTHWEILNAADYGVPQKRLRFVMLGIRDDIMVDGLTFPPIPTHQNSSLASNSEMLQPWASVGSALSRFPEPEDAQGVPNHQYSKYKLKFNGHIGNRYVNPELPAPTVTARGDEKGGVVVLHHPKNHRRMSARELAAVQSFPDDFIFKGTTTSVYRQVANAVPPMLGEAIGRMLLSNHKNSRVRD